MNKGPTEAWRPGNPQYEGQMNKPGLTPVKKWEKWSEGLLILFKHD